MNLFNLFAKIKLDDSEYTKKMNKAEKTAVSFSQKFTSGLKIAGKAIVGFVAGMALAGTAIAKLADNYINFGDEIDKNSQRLGMNAEEYQKWSMAVKLAGAETTTFKTAMRELGNFTKQLSEGNADALITLEKLGIGYEDFEALSPADQFKVLVESLQGVESQTDKARLAQELFGNRAYQELLPLLNQEVGSVDELFERTEALGLVMGDDAVKAAAALGDQLDITKTKIKLVGASIFEDFLPYVFQMLDGIVDLANGSDEGFTKISDSVTGMLDKVLEGIVELPKYIEKVSAFGMDMVLAIIDSVLGMDWGTFIVNLLDTLLAIIFVQLPDFVFNLVEKVIDLIFDTLFTAEGLEKIGNLGLRIAQSLVNGLLKGLEKGINLTIKPLNAILDGISSIWTWAGIPGIPHIPDVKMPQVKWYKDGGMFDKGTMYAIAGEDGAEIVHQGASGTGVANVKQISDAEYEAMRKYDVKSAIDEAVVGIVNGIVGGLRTSGGNGNSKIVVQIGGREMKDVVYKMVDDSLQSKGFKPLSKIGAQ